jgi:DNA-binding Lrp family transcriptional regulator
MARLRPSPHHHHNEQMFDRQRRRIRQVIASATVKSPTIDDTDRRILHALHVAPRAPFSRIGEVLDVSEQTVARRYQRMRTTRLIRVLGRIDPYRLPGTTAWTLRIGCRPGTAAAMADALARRPDTSWVGVGAGGAELTCQVTVTEAAAGQESLLHHLPRASNVLTFTAHQMLHRFSGRGEADWVTTGFRLTEEQRDRLRDPAPASDATVTPADRPLLTALLQDGRASYAALAAATGWSQRQVATRVSALSASGALFFDVDSATTAIGYRAIATLWFTVAPAHLVAVGSQLADHQELAFAGAVTGLANLMASAVCRDAEALYQYLTTRVGAIEEVRAVETIPLMTRFKQAYFRVDNGLLRDPLG